MVKYRNLIIQIVICKRKEKNMKYILESNENGLITLISAIVAIIALLQTHKQIKISNK